MLAPRFVFMQINKSCNLRCQHCSFWRDDDREHNSYMTADQRRTVLGEFAAMNPNGAVVLCGGEPMLAQDDFFAVTRAAREHGLTALGVVNGTRIRDAKMADRMIAEGLHEVSVSLNSHIPEVHDATRGVKGAFDKAVRAVRLLLEARARNPLATKTRIYVMALVYDDNYQHLDAFHDYVLNELGADRLKLNFLQPSFGSSFEEDRFYADHHRMDADVLRTVLETCDAKYNLGINPEWKRAVDNYVRSVLRHDDHDKGWASDVRTTQHICNSYDRNIMINPYGVARLCFSDQFRGMPLSEPGDLRRFWTGAEDARAEMRQCNRPCGISHSVRREPCTTKPAAYSINPPRIAEPRAPSMLARALAQLPQWARAG